MTKRPNPMDLRKSQEQLDAEGFVDPGPLPLEATTEEWLAWMRQDNKRWHPVTDEYREHMQAVMSGADGG